MDNELRNPYDNELRHTANEIGRRNLNFQRKWEFLNVGDLQFNRPAVICLSGSGTVENKSISSITHIVQNYLDLMFKTKDGKNALDYIDIIGIKYARKDRRSTEGYMTATFADKLTDDLVNLLTDENRRKLPLDYAKRKFASITFFFFCYGKQVLDNLISRLNEKLRTVGYTPNEILAINGASKEISFAAHVLNGNKIPSVHVISHNDPIAGHVLNNLYSAEQLTKLDGITLHQDPPGYLYGKQCTNATAPSIQIISSCLLNSCRVSHPSFDDHDIKCISRDNNWNLMTFQSQHKLHYSSNADCVSQMTAWALCRAVENSMQNFKATNYIPNNHWRNLVPELQSIIDSYAPEKLSKPTARFVGKKVQKNLEP